MRGVSNKHCLLTFFILHAQVSVSLDKLEALYILIQYEIELIIVMIHLI